MPAYQMSSPRRPGRTFSSPCTQKGQAQENGSSGVGSRSLQLRLDATSLTGGKLSSKKRSVLICESKQVKHRDKKGFKAFSYFGAYRFIMVAALVSLYGK